MDDAKMIAAVVAIVAAVRAQFPRVDGMWAMLCACAVGMGMVVLMGGGSDWRAAVMHGLMVGLSAAGGMKALAYGASKMPS